MPVTTSVSPYSTTLHADRFRSLHRLGILCALAAGAWLGGAEAPAKLVSAGFSPFAISLCMVCGVFLARWTIPIAFKGTPHVFRDLHAKPHLLVWAVLAGALWAVANTLTIFAIRDVGLAIAFPLWNTNCLIGLFWGWFLFRELQGAGARTWTRVLGGAVAIVLSAVMLSAASVHAGLTTHHRAVSGVLAALGAGLIWGTMYIPYRKAYISGMNPLSFVTVFTIGELGTVFALVLALDGGMKATVFHSSDARHMLFWLFLGGFVWVIGDLFQQYATKYLGIGRAIPLSNTNQLWGLAWGALVFGELAHANWQHRLLVVAGSVVMILGAVAVSTAVASEREQASTSQALQRECVRYGLDYGQVVLRYGGHEPDEGGPRRAWWDYLIIAGAAGIFIYLWSNARVPPLSMSLGWVWALAAVLVATASLGGLWLWKASRFS